MADVRLTVEDVSINGLDASYTSVNSSDTYLIQNTGSLIVHVKNEDTSSETVTVPTPKTINGLTVQDPTVTVSASGDKFIGPFPVGLYNNGQDMSLTFSNGTSTSVAVLKI
jgi:hypothetical protein